MGISTSDGQYFEDEFEMHAQQVNDNPDPEKFREKIRDSFKKGYQMKLDPDQIDMFLEEKDKFDRERNRKEQEEGDFHLSPKQLKERGIVKAAPDETEPPEVHEKHMQGFTKMLEDYGKRIDPKAWDAWIASMPMSENIEDRREDLASPELLMKLPLDDLATTLESMKKNQPKLPAKKKK